MKIAIMAFILGWLMFSTIGCYVEVIPALQIEGYHGHGHDHDHGHGKHHRRHH